MVYGGGRRRGRRKCADADGRPAMTSMVGGLRLDLDLGLGLGRGRSRCLGQCQCQCQRQRQYQ